MAAVTLAFKWGIRIDGSYSWFDSFVRNLASPDVGIIVDHEDDKPDQYLWVSEHLNHLSDPKMVSDMALAIKSLWDGAFYIEKGLAYRPLRFIDLLDLSSNKPYPIGKSNPLSQIFTGRRPMGRHQRGWLNPFIYFVSMAIYQARYDDVSRGMLQFVGFNGVTWISLYALLDFMKKNGWDEKKVELASGHKKGEVKRFTHTANNFAAIGPFARHGHLGHDSPTHPMTLDTAAELILSASKAFLIERCSALDLETIWAQEGS